MSGRALQRLEEFRVGEIGGEPTRSTSAGKGLTAKLVVRVQKIVCGKTGGSVGDTTGWRNVNMAQLKRDRPSQRIHEVRGFRKRIRKGTAKFRNHTRLRGRFLARAFRGSDRLRRRRVVLTIRFVPAARPNGSMIQRGRRIGRRSRRRGRAAAEHWPCEQRQHKLGNDHKPIHRIHLERPPRSRNNLYPEMDEVIHQKSKSASPMIEAPPLWPTLPGPIKAAGAGGGIDRIIAQ